MNKICILFLFFLSGCETTSGLSYYSHYQKCSLTETSISKINQCAKESRFNYIAEKKQKGSSDYVKGGVGDRFMMWSDLLAEQVKNKEVSDTKARMILIDKMAQIDRYYTGRQLEASRDAFNAINSLPKPQNCTTTLYGNTAHTSCY